MSPLLASLGRSLGRLMIAITVIIGLSVASPANADNWDAESLTIKSNPEGALVTFSEKDVKAGRKSFNQSCGACHSGGITKTNHNIGLDPETLALAAPARDNVEALVDFMKEPTSFDGVYSLSESHPSQLNTDIFYEMRDLNDDDLEHIAAFILTAPSVQGMQWGGGKIYW